MSRSLPSVREYLRRDTRPSHQQPDRWRLQVRVGKRHVRKLERRIAQLERELGEVGASVPPPMEPLPTPVEAAIEVAPSLKTRSSLPVPERPDQLIPPREGRPITDTRRPPQEILDTRADAAAERHRIAAEAWRKHAFAMNLAAARGLGARRWSSVYWNASPYRSGFGI